MGIEFMKKIIFLFLLQFTLIGVLQPFAQAMETEKEISAKLTDTTNYQSLYERNKRVETLTKFFEQQNSPFSAFAEVFIVHAEKNGLDWKLVPAISGVESTFGKAIPEGSFNAYGWNNGNYYFQSWEEGIEIVSKTLNEKYKQKWNAVTPQQIGRYYASSPTWANRVVYFMNQIENTLAESTLLPLNL